MLCGWIMPTKGESDERDEMEGSNCILCHIMNESYLRIVFDVGMIGSVDCPQNSTNGSTYSTSYEKFRTNCTRSVG